MTVKFVWLSKSTLKIYIFYGWSYIFHICIFFKAILYIQIFVYDLFDQIYTTNHIFWHVERSVVVHDIEPLVLALAVCPKSHFTKLTQLEKGDEEKATERKKVEKEGPYWDWRYERAIGEKKRRKSKRGFSEAGKERREEKSIGFGVIHTQEKDALSRKCIRIWGGQTDMGWEGTAPGQRGKRDTMSFSEGKKEMVYGWPKSMNR